MDAATVCARSFPGMKDTWEQLLWLNFIGSSKIPGTKDLSPAYQELTLKGDYGAVIQFLDAMRFVPKK